MDTLEEALEQMNGENVILAGDFNCILDQELDKNSDAPSTPALTSVRERFKNFIDARCLQDVWRARHPKKKLFTFRRAANASRLDLFLVSSQLTEKISQLKSQVSAQSDHVIISANINITESSRGPGLWKFDSSILTDNKFVEGMTNFLSSWSPPAEIKDPCVVWDWLKYEIKNHFIDYTKKQHSLEKQMLKALYKDLEGGQ